MNKRVICTDGGVQICFNAAESRAVFTEEDLHNLPEER